MRARAAIVSDGERSFAIGLGDDKIKLLVAKFQPPSTVTTGDYTWAKPSSPVVTGQSNVITGDCDIPQSSSPLVTISYTEASSRRTNGGGEGGLHTTARAYVGAAKPIEVLDNGSLVLHHPSGHTRMVTAEQIEFIAKANPALSRENTIIHLKALLCDFAQKEWRYVPEARWTQQLQKGVRKLADIPAPRDSEIQDTTDNRAQTLNRCETAARDRRAGLAEVADWDPDNPPDGFTFNDGIFVNGIEAAHPEIGSIKFDRVAQLANERLEKDAQRLGADDIRELVINELQADVRNRQLGAYGALLKPKYAAEDIAKVIAGCRKKPADSAVKVRGGIHPNQASTKIEHIVNFKIGTVAIRSGDVHRIMADCGATSEQVRDAIIEVDADLAGKIAQPLQAVLNRIKEAVQRHLSGGVGTCAASNPMLTLYDIKSERDQ